MPPSYRRLAVHAGSEAEIDGGAHDARRPGLKGRAGRTKILAGAIGVFRIRDIFGPEPEPKVCARCKMHRCIDDFIGILMQIIGRLLEVAAVMTPVCDK